MNDKLRDDVAFLKGRGIIKRDKEIADRTGFNKAVISTYLNGKINASKNFLNKFYEVFEKDLPANKVSTHLLTDKEKIEALEREIIYRDEIIAIKDKMIDAQAQALRMAEQLLQRSQKTLAHAVHSKKN